MTLRKVITFKNAFFTTVLLLGSSKATHTHTYIYIYIWDRGKSVPHGAAASARYFFMMIALPLVRRFLLDFFFVKINKSCLIKC